MKTQKYEIARAINKLKSIVQKNEQFKALEGILVNDGYLIASNTEITMKVKMEASAGERLIIPMKAFDLICSLPDGEVDINRIDGNAIMVKAKGIKNKYKSYDPSDFSFDITAPEEFSGIKLNGKRLMEALGHVQFAAADNPSNVLMGGIYLEGAEDAVKLAALGGHVVATDAIPAEGTAGMKIVVPKATVKKLVSMGVIDDVEISYNSNSAIFRTEEYTIFTRLIDGKYFSYEKMFSSSSSRTYAAKNDLIGAMTRAKMCADGERIPAVFKLEQNILSISLTDALADYHETVVLQDKIEGTIRIGFNSKLVLEALKAFTCENVALNFTNPKMPMIVEAEDSDMKVMVLPVAIREEKNA